MKLDIREILKETGNHLAWSFEEQLPKSLGVVWLSPVCGTTVVTHTGHCIVVQGKFSTEIELECGRCLTTVAFPIHAELEAQCPLSFFKKGEHKGAFSEDEDIEDEAELAEIFDQNSVDIGELCRQAAILQSPTQPLCKETCKGLCPKCGRDRNIEECHCGTDET